MTEQLRSHPYLCDLNEHVCVDDDTDDSQSWSVDSMSAVHKLSTSMSSMTTADADLAQDMLASADDNRLHRIPTLAASVKINVEGALIVDDETEKEDTLPAEHVHWERKDIRLPHHDDVVSHVAVDVPTPCRVELSFTDISTDRWLPRQACLLLSRDRIHRRRRQTQLSQLRDRPN
jgi:hypothetical protein